ncbi:MAG: NAD(P)H-dependent oxidoreductase subunit E [Candidatus Sumerlaeota bacterium]|nr:NAD(P)H-dependent oxidoreductase subunit E [Candidatus Sumerlaeota bacterium]
MPVISGSVAPPTDDKRWRLVDGAMRRCGYRASALIEVLHAAQSAFGFLDKDSLRYVARALRAPLSAVYGVATFYHYFAMKPPGEHTCVVCTGTACHVNGAQKLLAAVKERFGLAPGETSADGQISLLQAHCVGSCGLAPVAVLDRELLGRLSADRLADRLSGWRRAS